MLSNNFVDLTKTMYLVNLTGKFSNCKIFCKDNKTLQPRALVYVSKRVWQQFYD